MGSLSDKLDIKAVKKALRRLPTGAERLDLAYDQAVQRIDSQRDGHRILAKQTLAWITYAGRNITVVEIQHALAIELGEADFDDEGLKDIEDILSVCADLVISDGETGLVRLVHYTTQDYFKKNGDTLFRGALEEIAAKCLTYLLYGVSESTSLRDDNDGDTIPYPAREDFDDQSSDGQVSVAYFSIKKILQQHPLLIYAATLWATHARGRAQHTVKDLILTFVKSGPKSARANELFLGPLKMYFSHLEFRRSSDWSSAMHVFAYLGFDHLILMLLEDGFAADVKDSNNATPLWWAAYQGNDVVVGLLLSRKTIDLNNTESTHKTTALSRAARNGHDKVIKLLLSHKDIDVNLPEVNGATPLALAARNGHGTVVSLLLSRTDIAANSENERGSAPLALAVVNGKTDVIKQLLEREDIMCTLKKRISTTPLSYAGDVGHEVVMEFLFSCPQVDVDGMDDGMADIVASRLRYGDKPPMKLLVARADVSVFDAGLPGHLRRTPYLVGAMMGQKGAVEPLVAKPDLHGIWLNDWDDKRALLSAMSMQREAVLDLISQVNMSGLITSETREHFHRHWKSLLSAAIIEYHTTMAKLLDDTMQLDEAAKMVSQVAAESVVDAWTVEERRKRLAEREVTMRPLRTAIQAYPL